MLHVSRRLMLGQTYLGLLNQYSAAAFWPMNDAANYTVTTADTINETLGGSDGTRDQLTVGSGWSATAKISKASTLSAYNSADIATLGKYANTTTCSVVFWVKYHNNTEGGGTVTDQIIKGTNGVRWLRNRTGTYGGSPGDHTAISVAGGNVVVWSTTGLSQFTYHLLPHMYAVTQRYNGSAYIFNSYIGTNGSVYRLHNETNNGATAPISDAGGANYITLDRSGYASGFVGPITYQGVSFHTAELTLAQVTSLYKTGKV